MRANAFGWLSRCAGSDTVGADPPCPGRTEGLMTRQEEFVRRFHEKTPEVDDEIDIFLAWLQESGPDEWHRWAVDWNWDHGTELFWWIIAQPNCDRGTALSIYYTAQPDYFSRYASIEDARAGIFDAGDDVVGLMQEICQMWR